MEFVWVFFKSLVRQQGLIPRPRWNDLVAVDNAKRKRTRKPNSEEQRPRQSRRRRAQQPEAGQGSSRESHGKDRPSGSRPGPDITAESGRKNEQLRRQRHKGEARFGTPHARRQQSDGTK